MTATHYNYECCTLRNVCGTLQTRDFAGWAHYRKKMLKCVWHITGLYVTYFYFFGYNITFFYSEDLPKMRKLGLQLARMADSFTVVDQNPTLPVRPSEALPGQMR